MAVPLDIWMHTQRSSELCRGRSAILKWRLQKWELHCSGFRSNCNRDYGLVCLSPKRLLGMRSTQRNCSPNLWRTVSCGEVMDYSSHKKMLLRPPVSEKATGQWPQLLAFEIFCCVCVGIIHEWLSSLFWTLLMAGLAQGLSSVLYNLSLDYIDHPFIKLPSLSPSLGVRLAWLFDSLSHLQLLPHFSLISTNKILTHLILSWYLLLRRHLLLLLFLIADKPTQWMYFFFWSSNVDMYGSFFFFL